MIKLTRVILFELYRAFHRPSYWGTVLFIPLLWLLVYGVVDRINQREATGQRQALLDEQVLALFASDLPDLPFGYIDQAGIVRRMPPGFDEHATRSFPSEAEARGALDAGSLGGYYIIPPEYAVEGMIYLYTNQVRLDIDLVDPEQPIARLLAYNMAEGHTELLELLETPVIKINEINLLPENQRPRMLQDPEAALQNTLPFVISAGLMMLIYSSASLLLNGLGTEGQSRLLEVVDTSMNTYQFLLGKYLGLSIVGLVQAGIWGISSWLFFRRGAAIFTMPTFERMTPDLLFWAVVFSLGGYLFLGAVMVTTSALLPSVKDETNITFSIIVPLYLPILLMITISSDPHGWAAVLISFVPFTSPTGMILRMMVGIVPAWQAVLSILVLYGSSLLALAAAALAMKPPRWLKWRFLKQRLAARPEA